MRIPLLSASQAGAMRKAGRAAAATLAATCARVMPGVTTGALDAFVAQHTRDLGGRCAQLGYRAGGRPFPAHVCTSVNEVVCHGIPGHRVLMEGDIVNVDVTTELHGWHGDTSRTVAVGRLSPEAAHVLEVARRALDAGIAAVRPGEPLARVGEAIEALATREGCTVVRDFGGHGIGRRMHQAPHVDHTRTRERTLTLQPGMCFTIEPMVCLGSPDVSLLDDGWTVVTRDGRLSAQFEHTLLVTPEGAEVLTPAP